MTDSSQHDLSNYTSGRWIYNDDLRHQERRAPFNVDALRRLAAESVNQSAADVLSISKLAENGFNRTFVISLRNGSQVLARVPFPMTAPHFHTIASEVATIEYQRSCGIPVPDIYGYSTDSDNDAGTPYILMEFIHGPKLIDVLPSLGEKEIISVVHQLTQLEQRMMSRTLPAGGSLYFTEDLEKVNPGLGVPLENTRFCVGPDTRQELWYGRRIGLDVNRGPYTNTNAALSAGAQKEIAYLQRFGQPLLPFQRERRICYNYQKQSPLDHIKNLERYLSITRSIVPTDPDLSSFRIHHPDDLQPDNIFVSWSPGTACKIVSLIDWENTVILPMFLLAGVPYHLQSDEGDMFQTTTPPSRFDDMTEVDEEYYRGRLLHYHYITSAREHNSLHYAAFTDPFHKLRRQLFLRAGYQWEGETSRLKDVLIQAMNNWDSTQLTRGSPCPLEFDAKELEETAELLQKLGGETRCFTLLRAMGGGIAVDGWVQKEDYEEAVARFRGFKEEELAEAQSLGEREEIMAHWPWDDMDEEVYT